MLWSRILGIDKKARVDSLCGLPSKLSMGQSQIFDNEVWSAALCKDG